MKKAEKAARKDERVAHDLFVSIANACKSGQVFPSEVKTAWTNAAIDLQKRGRSRAAADAFAAGADALQGDSAWVWWYAAGTLYQAAGQADLALKALDAADAAKGGPTTDTMEVRAQALHAKGRASEAAETLHDVLRTYAKSRPTDDPKLPETATIVAGWYIEAERPADAIELTEKVVQWYTDVEGATSDGALKGRRLRSQALAGLGRADEAYREAVEIQKAREQRLGADDPTTIADVSDVSLRLIDVGRPLEAVPWAERAERDTARVHGDLTGAHAIALHDLGAAYLAAGRVDEAATTLDRAWTIASAAPDSKAADLVAILDTYAEALGAQGKPVEAIALVQRSIDGAIAGYGADTVEVGRLTSDRGVLRHGLGDLDGARADDLYAVETLTGWLGPTHPDVLIAKANLAGVEWDLGHRDAAIRLWSETLAGETEQLGAEHPTTAGTENDLAAAHAALGRPAEALPYALSALKHRQARLGSQHPQVAESLDLLAGIEAQLGRRADALPHHLEAVTVAEAAYGADSPQVAHFLVNLGAAQYEAGDYAAATATLQRALALSNEHSDVTDVRGALSFLSSIAYVHGRSDSAVELEQKGLDALRKQVGTDHPLVAEAESDLAFILIDAKRAKEAVPLAQHAVDTLGAKVGTTDPEYGEASLVLALATRAAGDPAASKAAVEAARPAIVEMRRHAALLSLDARMSEGPTWAWWGFQIALDADPEHAYDWALLGRGFAVDPTAGRICGETTDPALQSACACASVAREAKSGDTSASMMGRLAECDPSSPDELDAAVAAVRADPLASARRVDEAAALTLGKRVPLPAAPSGADVAAVLPSGSALIEWIRYVPTDALDARYVAFVVRPGQPAQRFDLGSAKAIDDAAAAWQAAASSPKSKSRGARLLPDAPRGSGSVADLDAAGTALSKLALDPLLPAISGATTLYVSPDGGLGLAALAALPVGSGRLGDGARILYVNTGADLLQKRVKSGKGAVIVADPAYGVAGPAQPDADRCRASVYDPLAAGPVELEAISPWLPSPITRLEGESATEAGLAESVKGARVVHLITHACYGESVDRGGRPDPLAAGVIVLAGANAHGPPGPADGFLTGHELSALPLASADLVVLSACETAKGDVTADGQGILGLRSGALAAGADAVVGSLWPVDDAATAVFFTAYYDAWAATDDPVEALDVAVKALKSKGYTHPYYWAPWTVAGRGR